jgi:hypothetical protein
VRRLITTWNIDFALLYEQCQAFALCSRLFFFLISLMFMCLLYLSPFRADSFWFGASLNACPFFILKFFNFVLALFVCV